MDNPLLPNDMFLATDLKAGWDLIERNSKDSLGSQPRLESACVACMRSRFEARRLHYHPNTPPQHTTPTHYRTVGRWGR